MKRKLLTSSLFGLFLIGCQQNTNQQKNDLADTLVNKDSISNQVVDQKKSWDWHPTKSLNKSSVLLTGYHRLEDNEELKNLIASKDWKEIYKKNGHYEIGPPTLNLSDIEEDPCSGMPMQSIVSTHHSFLLFDIPTIKDGNVDTVAFNKPIVNPGQPVTFVFKGEKYRLEASGITFYSDKGSNPKGSYTLKLFHSRTKEGNILLHQEDYNDTCTEVVMIADFDKDGIPDFILSSPHDYETERYLIILSSENTTYEGLRIFDC